MVCNGMIFLIRPFSHWSDATAIRLRKKSTTLYSWRVVIASWSRWWEKRHYELMVRPVGDCKLIFCSWSNRSRVASVGEWPKFYEHTQTAVSSIAVRVWSRKSFDGRRLVHQQYSKKKKRSGMPSECLKLHAKNLHQKIKLTLIICIQ
jgi:hypothetical protein